MGKDINLKELFSVIKRRFWLLILTTVLMTAGGYLLTIYSKPLSLYQSVTRLIVKSDKANMNTLMVMMKDPTVIEKVNQQLKGIRSANLISNELTVENINNSQVLSITAVDPSPVTAAAMANDTANVFINEAGNILKYNQIQVLSIAKINPSPLPAVHQHKTLYGVIAGVILGIGLMFFVDSFDESVQTEQELERILNVPALGSIPKMSRKYYFRRTKTKNLLTQTARWITSMKAISSIRQVKSKSGGRE